MVEYGVKNNSRNSNISTQAKQEDVYQKKPSDTVNSELYQLAARNPGLLSSSDIMQLQRDFGNKAVAQLLEDEEAAEETEDEEPVQAYRAVQLKKNESAAAPLQKKTNNTGLPDNIKTGVENLSGMSMDDVKVHYNSDKPADVQALAYTQGTDIHVAPGQEKHLAHEAWHVVQQSSGRVTPTVQTKDFAINTDESLEREADVMGEKAASVGNDTLQMMASEEESEAEEVPEEVPEETGE